MSHDFKKQLLKNLIESSSNHDNVDDDEKILR